MTLLQQLEQKFPSLLIDVRVNNATYIINVGFLDRFGIKDSKNEEYRRPEADPEVKSLIAQIEKDFETQLWTPSK